MAIISEVTIYSENTFWVNVMLKVAECEDNFDRLAGVVEKAVHNKKIMNQVKGYYKKIIADSKMSHNLDLLVKAVKGDKETEAMLCSVPDRYLFTPITYGQMNYIVIQTSKKLIGRLPANVNIAIAAVVILVALFVGILIITQVKAVAVNVAQQNNDTAATNLINNVFQTGISGIIILALSVLVLGAVVIIGYLRGMSGGR